MCGRIFWACFLGRWLVDVWLVGLYWTCDHSWGGLNFCAFSLVNFCQLWRHGINYVMPASSLRNNQKGTFPMSKWFERLSIKLSRPNFSFWFPIGQCDHLCLLIGWWPFEFFWTWESASGFDVSATFTLFDISNFWCWCHWFSWRHRTWWVIIDWWVIAIQNLGWSKSTWQSSSKKIVNFWWFLDLR